MSAITVTYTGPLIGVTSAPTTTINVQPGVVAGGGGVTYPIEYAAGIFQVGGTADQTISPYDNASGADVDGYDFRVAPGKGRGSGAAGAVKIAGARPGASGIDHALVDIFEAAHNHGFMHYPLKLADRVEGDLEPIDTVGDPPEFSYAVGADGKLLALIGGVWTNISWLGLAPVALSGGYDDLQNKPTLGAAAAFSVPTAGNAAIDELVKGDDTRLVNARTPTAHTHPLSDLTQSGATSGQVPAWNGSAWTPATPSAGSSEIVTLQASATTDVPAWARVIRCQVWGQGGAGGSGRKGATGTVACGGGAASSALYTEIWVAAADVGSTIVSVIPGAPAGGAAVTTDSTDGNPGAARTSTTVQLGQYLISVPGGVPGSGGTTFSGTGGTTSGAALTAPFLSVGGVVGASAHAGGSAGNVGGNNNWGNPGSGAGGGITTANVANAGGNGGYCQISGTQLSGGTGGAPGVNGTQGTAPLGLHGGGGAGGGGAALTGAAGAGANAVGYGGAGGGGGDARNGVGNSSGKGGDGTPGTVRYTFFR